MPEESNPMIPIAAKIRRSIHASTTARSPPAKRSMRMLSRPLRSCVAMPSTWPGSVRSDGSARRNSFWSCSCICVVLLVGQLREELGRLVGEVECRVDGPKRSFEGQQRPGEHRHRRRNFEAVAAHDLEHLAHRLGVEAAAVETLREHEADVGLERTVVGRTRHCRRGGDRPGPG